MCRHNMTQYKGFVNTLHLKSHNCTITVTIKHTLGKVYFNKQGPVFISLRDIFQWITAAVIMGTTCWPFNFIHVRRWRLGLINEKVASTYYCCLSAAVKKQWQVKPQRWQSTISFTHIDLDKHKHPKHMVPSAKHSPDQDTRGVCLGKLWAGFTVEDLQWPVTSPLSLLQWYVPETCQRHLNEEDELQRQLVQRQLAWTRRQTEQRGVTLGCEGSPWIGWTSSVYVWQGQTNIHLHMTVVRAAVCRVYSLDVWLSIWSVVPLSPPLSILPSLHYFNPCWKGQQSPSWALFGISPAGQALPQSVPC